MCCRLVYICRTLSCQLMGSLPLRFRFCQSLFGSSLNLFVSRSHLSFVSPLFSWKGVCTIDSAEYTLPQVKCVMVGMSTRSFMESSDTITISRGEYRLGQLKDCVVQVREVSYSPQPSLAAVFRALRYINAKLATTLSSLHDITMRSGTQAGVEYFMPRVSTD